MGHACELRPPNVHGRNRTAQGGDAHRQSPLDEPVQGIRTRCPEDPRVQNAEIPMSSTVSLSLVMRVSPPHELSGEPVPWSPSHA